MKKIARLAVSLLLIFAFLGNVLPCGPSYISPIFEYKHAPENPYENFAAGKIGILKPTQRRIVLLAAYRYLNGGGFSAPEQKALVEVWNAEFNNQPYEEDNISETVKQWIEKRKSVVGKEEKPPEIYVEREYGGYDFFPNCTKNAFETATQTLADRLDSHGSEDQNVKNWVAAQDRVFENCASGKATPDPVTEAMPEWLQKDRAYQLAAAEFYALDFDSARRRFSEIAQDYSSPWQETAEYLVGRSLIRQASLIKDKTNSEMLYREAEQTLSGVGAKGGKFSDSAEKMIGLIKYRLRPEERVRELAQIVATQGDGNFRQDLIDYNWLLDKFEKQTLGAEEKRKEEIKQRENEGNINADTLSNGIEPDSANSNAPLVFENGNSAINSQAAVNSTSTNSRVEQSQNEGDLRIYLYSDDYKENWTFFIEPAATDAEALQKAEQIVGRPLSDKMKELVRNSRKEAYRGRFDGNNGAEYEGGYYGAEKVSLSILPDYLRNDDLTNWLFTFQTPGSEAYLYALSQLRETGSNLWLLTALSKAEKSSTELNILFEAAEKTDRNSPAYPTIAYHQARILMEQGNTAKARKLLDEILDSGLELPISSRNLFLQQRAQLSETLDDYLKFAQLKPFAFDWDGTSGTIEDFIKQQKSWYTPESYPNKTREEYEKEVEDNFKNERVWQDRAMFDADTINVMNNHFPLPLLLEAEKSPALPEYLRERFAIGAWTRAVLLNDFATAEKISPEVVKFHPELEESLTRVDTAKTPTGKARAAFYVILKNPMFSPYLEDGLGKADNEFNTWDANDWWCAPYESEYDEATGTEVKVKPPRKPLFLTAAQSNSAQEERKKLAAIGDAPKFFGEKILEWARLAPADKRVPELLYITREANGWTKYGCGNNEELRKRLGDVLKRQYPQSEWKQKILDEEKEQ